MYDWAGMKCVADCRHISSLIVNKDCFLKFGRADLDTNSYLLEPNIALDPALTQRNYVLAPVSA